MPAPSDEQKEQRPLINTERYVPMDIRVRQHPAFGAWVASGGLAEFAKEHNLEPNFIDSLNEQGCMVIVEYYETLSRIPGLREEIEYESEPVKGGPMSDAAAEAAMAYAEGWDIDDYEDDSEDEKSQQDNGKESAEKDVKMEEGEVPHDDFLLCSRNDCRHSPRSYH